jgi:hypothetical protein
MRSKPRWYPILLIGAVLFLAGSIVGCPQPRTPPVIAEFSANPTNINFGESATLSWSVTEATAVTIDQGIGDVPSSGTQSASPTTTTTYTLTAINSAGIVTESVIITVVIPPAAKLVFTIQPDGATGGSPFTTQPEVTVEDVNGNTVTSSDASVTLSIISGTDATGATLSGTTTVNAVNGVAKFADLSIDKAGTGYTLMATSGGLSFATSKTFDVVFDAEAVAWEYLQGLAKGDTGKEVYDAIRNNIYEDYVTPYSGQDWWPADWPKDSWYFYLMLFVDQGSGTLLRPPGVVVSTIESTGPVKSPFDGRQVVYFGWIIKPDGTVYPLPAYAPWLEEQLSGVYTPSP